MEILLSEQFFIPAIKLVVALVLGSVLGIERSFIGKTAGMRTYGLVAMGSALFITTTALIADPNVFDQRVAAGIITGIGFLGAGLIIFQDQKITGLTTSAGLWVSAGIGIAVGFGFYLLAIFATLLVLFNFTIMWRIENRIKEDLKEIADKTDHFKSNRNS